MLILLIGFEETGPSIYTIFQKQYYLVEFNSNFNFKIIYIYIYIYILYQHEFHCNLT